MTHSERINGLTAGGGDRVLIESARNGNREAFSHLAEVQYPRLLRIACRFVGNTDEAQDVVQDALCNAFLHISEYGTRLLSPPGWCALREIRRSPSCGGAKRIALSSWKTSRLHAGISDQLNGYEPTRRRKHCVFRPKLNRY